MNCPACRGKFKNKQSLATHKRRYHPSLRTFKKGLEHDHLDNPSHRDVHQDTSDDNPSTSDDDPSDTENEGQMKTVQDGIGTANEDTDGTVDGTDGLENTQSESDVSVVTHKIKPTTKRKTIKSYGHENKKQYSFPNRNVFDDHMNLELDALASIEEKLETINTSLRKIISESKSPWSRLDAFEFKQHYFPNLEECSQHLFSKPVKNVLTETEMSFVDAVQSEQNLTDLTTLLNENQQLFLSIMERFKNCDKNNKQSSAIEPINRLNV